MKRDDPKRLAARALMDKAHDQLRVLAVGFASVLEQRCYNAEDVRDLLALMNETVPPAIAIAEKAEKDYEPYRPRRVRMRRVSRSSPSKPNRIKRKGAQGGQ